MVLISPVLQLRNVTLQSKVKLLRLRKELPEQKHVGMGSVDEFHFDLTAHHCLQPVQHFPHFVHSESVLHQPSHKCDTGTSEQRCASFLPNKLILNKTVVFNMPNTHLPAVFEFLKT